MVGNGELSGAICCNPVDAGTSLKRFAVDEESVRLVAGV